MRRFTSEGFAPSSVVIMGWCKVPDPHYSLTWDEAMVEGNCIIDLIRGIEDFMKLRQGVGEPSERRDHESAGTRVV